jgi:hypothetical protein
VHFYKKSASEVKTRSRPPTLHQLFLHPITVTMDALSTLGALANHCITVHVVIAAFRWAKMVFRG